MQKILIENLKQYTVFKHEYFIKTFRTKILKLLNIKQFLPSI